MSTPTIAEPEAVNFETQFHIDKDVNDPENYLVITSSWAAASSSTRTRYDLDSRSASISARYAHRVGALARSRVARRAFSRPRPFGEIRSSSDVESLFRVTPLPPTGEDGAHGTSPPRSIDPNSISSTPSRAAPARAASSARSARRFATVSGPNPIQLSGFFLKRRKESSPPSFSPTHLRSTTCTSARGS